MEGLEKVLIILQFCLVFGLMFLIHKGSEEEKNRKEQIIFYMEKAGTGVVIGKMLANNPEVAIQFKDTILYSKNKEWYYLLKEGDSIQVKNGKIIKKN